MKTEIGNFNDVRKITVETILDLRDGKIPAHTALACAALLKTLWDSVQVEVNVIKVLGRTDDNLGKISVCSPIPRIEK